jgi:hypothetical protein
MKYRLRAQVEGTIYLPKKGSTLEAERNGTEYRLESDEEGRVVALSVCKRIPEEIASKFRATATYTPEARSKAHLEFRVDLPFHNALLAQLQDMESLLAFRWSGHPLKRVRWHEAAASLVPENPEEEKQVSFWDISIKRRPPSPKRVIVDPKAFRDLVEHAPRFQVLTVPMGFWREGMNQLERGEFVQAFYSHYFVIEDFFADGKTSEPEVLKAFSRSQEFNEICQEALRVFFESNDEPAKGLRALFSIEGCQLDVPGLQKFLFRIRGRAHHYSGKSSKLQATPFTQEQFRPAALLSMHISTLAISRRIVAINKEYWGETR